MKQACLFFALFCHLVWAADANSLLYLEQRPHVAQLKRALDPWPLASPYTDMPISSTFYESIYEVAAETIALMELAYPGAVWAPLGRDSVSLGDFLEAFYEAAGQTGRVRRLGASGHSFVMADESLLIDFLRGNGLEKEVLQNERPFVIVDRTRFGSTSQSTRLYLAGVGFLMDKKLSVPLLTQRFGVLSVHENFPSVRSQSRVKVLNETQANALSMGTMPNALIGIPGARYLIDWEAWHDPFLRFYRDEAQRVRARPGRRSEVSLRRDILDQLFQITQFVSSPRFLKMVQAEAGRLGYSFPIERFETVRYSVLGRPAENLEELRENLHARVNQMQPPTESYAPGLSPNGRDLHGWFLKALNEEMARDELALLYIKEILRARASHRISLYDLRPLLRQAFENSGLTRAFYRKFREEYLPRADVQRVLRTNFPFYPPGEERTSDVATVAENVRRAFKIPKCTAAVTK